MLNVTDAAQERIARFFDDNEIKPIRVFMASRCGGSQMALALDSIHPDDATFEFAGIQYVVDKVFLELAQPIEIDFAGEGFKVTTALPSNGGCGGCGSSESCCS
ncbi:IscA/HesB family protein [Desulfatitalea alkaliphila]|uniref:IscA/HesB family protein n=1 Tax=Desulfatitalea alkaliphila TaxID=2929485 RepID=A0AA41UNN1_9BACT|nr:IscA/HesB family protein [Desulfatitalea alkaliphila]MCJ8499663.1 IscA/HesB family protein [Desulfatitalea alkaliphila]